MLESARRSTFGDSFAVGADVGGEQAPAGGLVCFVCFVLFCFWLHHVACGILFPRPGIEPSPPAVEVQSLNHWIAREAPEGP